jgi:Gamma-glutamyl cyclotransferase, AIG2-like
MRHGMMFLYGTLLEPATLAARSGEPATPARCQAASLTGWTRVRLGRTPWPTLARERGGLVPGAIVPVTAAAARRLAAYEGPAYRLTRVTVHAGVRPLPAWAWIAPGGTKHPWKR